MCFFLHTLLNGFTINTESLFLLNIAQSLALFEILNAILGIAGANWALTAIQVCSRLLLLGLLNWIPEELLIRIGHYSGFSVVAVAWSVTEIVRALYYLNSLFGKEIKAISWSRYTFFILLYPMGVIGEFTIMFTFLEWRQFELNTINTGVAVVAVSYFLFFPKLYGHMCKQRKKKRV